MLEHTGQTAIRGGLVRWLTGPGNRFRHDDAQRTPGSCSDGRLAALLEAGYTTPNELEVTRLMEQALRAALHDTGATLASIMTLDGTENDLVVRAAVCIGESPPLPDSHSPDGVEGQVFRTGEPQMLPTEPHGRGKAAVWRSSASLPRPDEAILCVPLLERSPGTGQGRTLGVLTLRHTQAGKYFSAADCRLARDAAGLIAGALAHEVVLAEHKRAVIGTLRQVVVSLEAKDPYTIDHSPRVTEVCALMAAELDLDARTVQQLRIGAMLHDIGKIGVPAGILNKPGNLTDEELALLKRYPIIGYNLCEPLDLGDEILLLIRNHTEKLDGTGYPDGLRPGQLPLPLRILSVVDAFDAMSSYRPYRKAMDARERNEQLNRFAGTQFDPTVVETLKGLLNGGHLDELYRDQWQLSAEMHERSRAA